MDPATKTVFDSLVADILPALQTRLQDIARLPAGQRESDDDTRHLIIDTIELLAGLRGWLGVGSASEEVPSTSSTPAQPVQVTAAAAGGGDSRKLDGAALERLSTAISAIELDHLKLLSATKALMSEPQFSASGEIRKFADLTTGIVKSFAKLRASVDTVQRRTGEELASALGQAILATGAQIPAEIKLDQVQLDHPMLQPVATVLAELMRGAAEQGRLLVTGRVSAGMIRLSVALDPATGQHMHATHSQSPWFRAAAESARAIKGIVSFDAAGQGSLTFEVPASLRGIKGIVVRAGDQHYALPDYGIVETLRLDGQRVQTIDGQDFLNIHETSLPLVSLPKLLGHAEPAAGAGPTRGRYALIVQSRGSKCGLVVDELVQHRELTLRPLGGALASRPEIFGGAVDGDGKVIVVLDPREIGSRA
jgi:hypothetical protein